MKNMFTRFGMLLIAGIAGLQVSAQVTTVTVKDSISTDTHWTCGQQYLLKGYVYVTNGATLTIDPGTIIRGDKNTKGSLIIERGAKLMAEGTLAKPIVFTSAQPKTQRSYGDWGGVILCGKAPVNWNGNQSQVEGGPRSLYGGTDAADNSGSLKYVRIEFPGVPFSPNNEINGLTLCGVGTGTTLEHIQVSYSGDDSYEWFGGSVNGKYLVAFAGWDDDFDTDNGYNGSNQYGMGLRDPFAADQSGSKAWESDSYQSGTATGLSGDTSKLTKPVFANFTAIGPLVSPTSTAYDPQFVAAAHIRRGSALSILNSVIVGYPAGILVDNDTLFGLTTDNIQSGTLQIANNAIAGIPVSGTVGNKEVFFVRMGARSLTPTSTWGDTLYNTPFGTHGGPFGWLQDGKNKVYPTAQNGVRLQNPFNLANPNLVPTSTSPIAYNNKSLPAYITGDPFANGKKYPYDGTKAINTDTSNLFANYNAPDLLPNTNSWKIQTPFFAPENHIGAFGFTATTSDNWTSGWCNWDPNNTDYDNLTCSVNAVPEYDADKLYLRVSPNPARDAAIVGYKLAESANVTITLFDINGRMIKTLFEEKATSGDFVFKFETTELNSGLYFVNVKTDKAHQSIKLSVIK